MCAIYSYVNLHSIVIDCHEYICCRAWGRVGEKGEKEGDNLGKNSESKAKTSRSKAKE